MHELLIQLLHVFWGRLHLRVDSLLRLRGLFHFFTLFGVDRIGHLNARLITILCLIIFLLIFVCFAICSCHFTVCWLFLSFQLRISLLLRVRDALTPLDRLLHCLVLGDSVGRGFRTSIFRLSFLFIILICFGLVLFHFILNLYFKIKLSILVE